MTAPSPAAERIAAWFQELLRAEDFALDHVPLADSREWAPRAGAIRHRTGRFFSVVGVRARFPDGAACEQPLLEQREVGTLLFLVREGGDLLVQAKVEPGNVGVIQLAPTFQATGSNAARAHGGAPPPLHEWCLGVAHGTSVASTLQSEQGTRFLGKRNRNAAILVAGDVPHGAHHRWLPARELCSLLAADHMVNTDARSALLCMPWDLLAGGRPFGGDGFAGDLRASLDLPDARAWRPLDEVVAGLAELAPWREAPGVVPLERLAGWRMAEEGPEPAGGGSFRLRHVRVAARSREVPEWDQPIVESAGPGEVILPVGRFVGVPHFLFRPAVEPGFGSRVEFTPALTAPPGVRPAPADSFAADLRAFGREIASCLQSEEGGRFLRDENRYALLDVGEATDPPEGWCWLSLAQVRALLDRGESLTNEARSALSLLLGWL